jgi:hypothetical protein
MLTHKDSGMPAAEYITKLQEKYAVKKSDGCLIGSHPFETHLAAGAHPNLEEGRASRGPDASLLSFAALLTSSLD